MEVVLGLLILGFIIGGVIFYKSSFKIISCVAKITNAQHFIKNQHDGPAYYDKHNQAVGSEFYLMNIHVQGMGDFRLNNETVFNHVSIAETVIVEIKIFLPLISPRHVLHKVTLLSGEEFFIHPDSLISLPK